MNCEKEGYSKLEAKKILQRVRLKHKSIKLIIYDCRNCHQWHLSSNAGAKWGKVI